MVGGEEDAIEEWAVPDSMVASITLVDPQMKEQILIWTLL